MSLPPVKFVHEKVQGSVAYVLDDDSRVGALVSSMLQAAGFDAISFTEPGPCLKQLKTSDDYNTPSIFVLDLSLGKTDGIEVLNELKNLKYKGRVLLISGKDESALQEIEKMGVSRGLVMLPSLKKPFRKDDLTKRLNIEIETARPSAKEPAENSPITALERAMLNRTLVHRYQPIIDLKSKQVCGAKLVLHERHPTQNLVQLPTSSVPPNAPILHPVSRYLLRAVLEDWQQHLSILRPPVRFYINLPLAVVRTAVFLTLIRETLSPHPQFPGLVIEVNDWHLNDLKTIQELSAQLKLYGVGLSVDDIAAVYSAITGSYKFPFVEFKLNSSFVSNCALNETKQTLCRDTVKLAQSVGALVCAEGVATADELQILTAMNCSTAMGQLIGGPQPVDVVKTKLSASSPAQSAEKREKLPAR
jgi:EAL domain-containing protein (putative c-di-GMP-specific phosphodiesterase class I)/CheY-like chemotaxis protein